MKNQFAKTTLSLGVLAGLTGVTPVTAQQSSVADENVEVIEVTSFRSSLIRAKDLKTKNTQTPFSKHVFNKQQNTQNTKHKFKHAFRQTVKTQC